MSLTEEVGKRMLRRKFNLAIGAMKDAVTEAVRGKDEKTALKALDEFDAIGRETITEAIRENVSWWED